MIFKRFRWNQKVHWVCVVPSFVRLLAVNAAAVWCFEYFVVCAISKWLIYNCTQTDGKAEMRRDGRLGTSSVFRRIRFAANANGFVITHANAIALWSCTNSNDDVDATQTPTKRCCTMHAKFRSNHSDFLPKSKSTDWMNMRRAVFDWRGVAA